MSRKAKEDKSSWKMPSMFVFVGEYGPFRANGYKPIENTLVWLCNSLKRTDKNDKGGIPHVMHYLAGPAQNVLLQNASTSSFSAILVIDLKDMFETLEEYEETLAKEMEEIKLCKHFGRKILRLFQRISPKQVTIAAQAELCPMLLKLHKAIQHLDRDMISDLWLLYPELSTEFINAHLVLSSPSNSKKYQAKLHLVTTDKVDNRTGILNHFFQTETTLIITNPNNWFHVVSFGQDSSDDSKSQIYDPEYCNAMGKTLFCSKMVVEMNRHTKQYERNCEDITTDLLEIIYPEEETMTISDFSKADWSTCEEHVGALVLRGNRCVLVRSVGGEEWKGMRLPSVKSYPGESPHDTAIRALVEFTEVEANAVKFLPHVLPVAIYAPNGRPILVHLYPMYAVDPPPDGLLEDADMEDDESYDWYTFPNAVAKLDNSSIVALQTMALNLSQAANAGLVPTEWGGVFGQELKLTLLPNGA